MTVVLAAPIPPSSSPIIKRDAASFCFLPAAAYDLDANGRDHSRAGRLPDLVEVDEVGGIDYCILKKIHFAKVIRQMGSEKETRKQRQKRFFIFSTFT